MATSLLLADDSPTIAKILGMALQSEEYEIRSALTAEDAQKELQANPPFFFLVDLTLPGKNGYEFTRLIRADRRLKDVKVLLLASAFDPADDAEVAACGADGVINKPFDPGELRRRLREVRDAPPKFAGAQPQGSLGGHAVTAPPAPAPAAAEEPALDLGEEEVDPLAILAGSGDANSILSSELGLGETDEAVNLSEADLANAALLEGLDASAGDPVLDLSNSFSTPPRGTDLIEISRLNVKAPPPAAAPAAPAPADEPLSANAQALAAFFAAEIDGQAPANPAAAPAPSVPASPSAADDDAFDASLSSIEWGAPQADLNDWSSASSPKAAFQEPAPGPAIREKATEIAEKVAASPAAWAPQKTSPAPAPAQMPVSPAPAIPSPAPAGASSEGGSFLFDTGGSNFRFAEDYVQRITKAFTGNLNETMPERDPAAAMYSAESDDRTGFIAAPPPAAHPVAAPAPAATLQPKQTGLGGGAWSPEEVKRIEEIVRHEVQMVVREIAEKVVWEVVPELAENLIKKELEKVLKEMEE